MVVFSTWPREKDVAIVQRGRLLRFSEESVEHGRIASDLLFGIENSFKAYRGEEKAWLLTHNERS